ncbi:MAG: amidase [Vicinamibacterales bacterium]
MRDHQRRRRLPRSPGLADSPVVANLRAAGALFLGRTNTPAFSFRLDTANDLRGVTVNPWSRPHTPGGSSGGAASAVASGIVPIAHGNDIAGSIRYPAYACGLVGLRPSFGRVPAFNPTATAERSISSQLLSVQGPIARSIRDLRLALDAMAARDARDPWWVPAPLDGAGPPTPVRVAVVTEPDDLDGARLHPVVTAALVQAAAWLAEAGYEIVDRPTPGFTRAKELWFGMQMPEIREYLWPLIEQHGDDGIRRAMGLMLEAHPAADGVAYMRALALRARVVRDWQQFLDDVPLVLAPVCTEPVYRKGFDLESADRTAAMWRESVTLTAVPVLGLPGLAVPTGVVDGLPMGVQIVGPRFREDLCLAAGAAIEARAGMFARLPVDPSDA